MVSIESNVAKRIIFELRLSFKTKSKCKYNLIGYVIYLLQQFEICMAISVLRLHCGPSKISYRNRGHWLAYSLVVRFPSEIKQKKGQRQRRRWGIAVVRRDKILWDFTRSILSNDICMFLFVKKRQNRNKPRLIVASPRDLLVHQMNWTSNGMSRLVVKRQLHISVRVFRA